MTDRQFIRATGQK